MDEYVGRERRRHRAPRAGRGVVGTAVAVAGVVVGGLAAGQVGASGVVDAGLGYDPSDLGSPWSVGRIVRAQDAWAGGWTGAGVDVAVIDTGVAPVPGLDAPGKVVTGPDLSFDAPGAPVPGLDAYGHGTFMAGLIAGRDGAEGAGAGYADPSRYVGVAPDARIIDVKVGAADGAVDVTQVIAAVGWVVQHAHDPGVNIRVISLSFGTDSTQGAGKDPLAAAAEQAWLHGIVVVAASGNDGTTRAKMADPAYDPYVIAAGADDPVGTLATADDVVPAFAQHGTTNRPVDVIAPAMHVIGLRVPGGFVDTMPGNVGRVGSRFQRGTGTSQAAAIVSGVAALVLQKHPDATPDQVKAAITRTAAAPTNQVAKKQKVHWGSGVVDASAALAAPLPTPAESAQKVSKDSKGKGTLDETRAGVYVASQRVNLTGERDIFGKPFDGKAMAVAEANASAWTGGIWNSSRWTGDGWSSSRWTAVTWTGADWAGRSWASSRWTGMVWDSSRWTGSGWGSSRWTGTGWDASRWAIEATN